VIWQRHDKYSFLSDCGRYSVCDVGLSSDHRLWEAWRTSRHPLGRKQGRLYPSEALAKRACERDEEKQERTQDADRQD
jgi:hypothetical protein